MKLAEILMEQSRPKGRHFPLGFIPQVPIVVDEFCLPVKFNMFQYSVGGAIMPDAITYSQDCMSYHALYVLYLWFIQ